MIELGRHIEILLLDNDCVIVPEFGGFVDHQVGARYDERDHMWLPPTRTLGFNPQLRINDSLLVQSYVNAYDISYPEALRRIEEEVETLKQELLNEGTFTLDDIGTLTVNSEGNYLFEPCEAGILSPEYYGLGCCAFPTLKEQREIAPATVAAVTETAPAAEEEEPQSPTLLEFTDNDTEDDDRAIQIKMSWIRNTVAIAAAIIAFFVMVTPIANSDLGTRTMSQLQNNLLYKLIPQDTNMMPATPVVDTIAQKVVAKSEEKPAEPVKATTEEPVKKAPVKVAESPQQPYCIVLASQVRKSNAEDYVQQLKKRGFEEAEVYIHNNVVRVIFGAYASESEAYRQLNKMASHEEFGDAWVYKIQG